MINEVYLICSLPTMSFGDSPPITEEEFDHVSKTELSASKYRILEEVSIRLADCNTASKLSKRIHRILEDLQLDVSEIRRNKSINQTSNTQFLPKIVLSADPLKREIEIMKWLWEKIEELESGKTFTMSEVIAYKLKLQILHRLNSFNKENGTGKLASILEKAEKSVN